MTRVLNRCPGIAIGIERYKNLKHSELGEHLFTEERFFDFRAGDTNVIWPKYYSKLRKKFVKAKWFGDKLPRYYMKYSFLFERFENSVVIFMLRDIHDVASSWNKRAETLGDTWPESHDYKEAVSEWNRALKQTLEFKRKYGNRLLIVEYEKIFSGDSAILAEILTRLNLPMRKSALRMFRTATQDWDEISQKPRHVRDGQAEFISLQADMRSYETLKRLAISHQFEAIDI